MKYKYVALIFVFGIALGLYAKPAKVVEKEVVKIIEKVVKDTTEKEKKNTIKITVETIMPDGTIRREIKEIDKGVITIDTSELTERDETKEKEKIVVNDKNSVIIYALGGGRIGDFETPTFGLGIQKRLLGPIYFGLQGTQKKDIAITLGLSF